MELRQLYTMLRKWLWLLGVGLVAGLLLGIAASFLQKPVYEASAKLFVSKSSQTDYSGFAGLTNQQLVQTYVQILRTNRLRDDIARQLGVDITPNQVVVQQVSETQIIEVKVMYPDADLAAIIANALIQKIIKDDEATDAAHFATQEESLTRQIGELDTKIASLQDEYDKLFEQDYQSQLDKVDREISGILAEISTLQKEISQLNDANTAEERARLADLQLQVSQLQTTLGVYQGIRANLIIQGKVVLSGRVIENPKLTQLQSAITAFQDTQRKLTVELETARQVHEHRVPYAELIEEASAPLQPARPSRLLYAALGGIVGFMLAGAVMTALEAFRGAPKLSEITASREEVVPVTADPTVSQVEATLKKDETPPGAAAANMKNDADKVTSNAPVEGTNTPKSPAQAPRRKSTKAG